jgi:hypothetical protein
MKNNKRICKLLESYINGFRRDAVESFYGKGSVISITNLTYALKSKTIIVELTIKLGDLITEEIMDTSMSEVLVSDAMVYFNPNLNIRTIVSWDIM